MKPVESDKKLCDDEEDCFEGGSGSGEISDIKGSVHNTNLYGEKQHKFKEPETTPGYVRPFSHPEIPLQPTKNYEDNSILYTSKPIPPALPPNYIGIPHTVRPSPPPRPAGPPVIVQVPIPDIPLKAKENLKPTTTYTKSSADRTAMVIGLIAIILIVIVIIAPLIVFIKVRYRTGTAFKVEETKNFHFTPVAGTPVLLGPSPGSHQTQLNGTASKSQNMEQKAPKLPKKKDLKEWYV